MKNMRKIASLILALVMVCTLASTVFAATGTDSNQGGTATIKVTLPTVPEGTTANNTYYIYKVFDATSDGTSTNISYTLVDGKNTAPAGFTVDAQGNVTYAGTSTTQELTDADIAAIAAYVANDTPVATVNTTAEDTEFTVTELTYGYYYITTTTGTVVTVDSTNPVAEVIDKNTVPEIDKQITGANGFIDEKGKNAIAQVGTDVTFTATVTVGTGAENYVFHDKMTDGLSYNNDVTVKIGDAVVAATNYNTTTAADDTLTVSFNNDYIKTLAKDTVITISYTAKITNAALTVDSENNTAYLNYGDVHGNNRTPNSSTQVYSAKISVTKKKESTTGEALQGAGFVIQNSTGKYYKYTAPATEGAAPTIEWVDNISDATEHVSGADGAVEAFVGLKPGTYKLVEKTVPTGYKKAADTEFTVAEGNYTTANLEQAATVVNNAGSELPSTGGMGTTMFYILGGILVAAAVVLLVTKKRMASAE